MDDPRQFSSGGEARHLIDILPQSALDGLDNCRPKTHQQRLPLGLSERDQPHSHRDQRSAILAKPGRQGVLYH
jgi:hypothetical protein